MPKTNRRSVSHLLTSSHKFCSGGDTIEWLAVLGIFSHDGVDNAALRRTSRETWMREEEQQAILSRFVMRGVGLSTQALQEARTNGDTIFVQEPADAPYKVAPLRSLLSWWSCALMSWPRARLIGKADDDVAVMSSRVALHLHATFASLKAKGLSSLYWGMMETMHWDVETHRPASPFEFDYGRGRSCVRRRSPDGFSWPNGTWFTNKAGKLFWKAPNRHSDRHPMLPAHKNDVWRSAHRGTPSKGLYIGPFFFAKGPLYFISRELVAQMNDDRGLRRDAVETVASALNVSYKEPTWPWEDIYTGLALTQTATAHGAPLAAVHIGRDAFLESYSGGRGRELVLKQSMLLWHERAKLAAQMRQAHRWVRLHGCNVSALELSCERVATSCARAAWRLCEARQNAVSYTSSCDPSLRKAGGSPLAGLRPRASRGAGPAKRRGTGRGASRGAGVSRRPPKHRD